MTGRQYAKYHGVTEGAVRKALAEGRITAGPDGQIDPATADAQWEKNSSKAEKAPRGLTVARNRQGRARLAALEHQVEELRGSLAPPALAQEIVSRECVMIIDSLRQWFAGVATLVTTLPATEAARRLDDAAMQVLTDLAAAESPSRTKPPTPQRRPPPRSAVEIEERRVTLRAELLELKNAQRTGELVRIEVVMHEFADRLVQFRGMMLALPTRVVRGVGPLAADEADKLLDAELAGIIQCLTTPPIVRTLQ